MRQLKKSEYFLAALLMLVAGFPLAVKLPTAGAVPLPATVATTMQQQALDQYSTYRQDRRDYEAATALCIQLRAQGQKVTCPDINDYNGIEQFLNGNYNSSMHGAAADSSSSVLQVSDLNASQLGLLRWYERINNCPLTLKNSLSGFYDLCESMLNLNATVHLNTLNAHAGVATSETITNLQDIINANHGVNHTH